MKVILPCAGRSSRFPNQPPKWTLPANDGRPMIAHALSGFEVKPSDIIVTTLREHEEKFNATHGLKRALGNDISVVVIEEPTRSQSETVAATLRQTGLNEPFIVKDCDNVFAVPDLDQAFNYVTVASLNDFDSINPRNKSYVQTDQQDFIVNFREKKVISDLFCVGGYFFQDPSAFLGTFERLAEREAAERGEIYLSDVISAMILDGVPFRVRRVTNYQDWGTIHDWRRALERQRTLFVLVDGFLFERGSTYFTPHFEDVRVNVEAANAVNKAAQAGHQIVYLTVRPAALAALTETQLKDAGLPLAPIVYDLATSKWALVTAAHPTLPFGTSTSFELDPADPQVFERLDID